MQYLLVFFSAEKLEIFFPIKDIRMRTFYEKVLNISKNSLFLSSFSLYQYKYEENFLFRWYISILNTFFYLFNIKFVTGTL